MRARLHGLLVLIAALTSAAAAGAQQNLALDSYTCGQFLADTQEPTRPETLLRSVMMISWATGYAAAFQGTASRADAAAIVLMAGTLGEACRQSPDRKATEVVAAAVRQYAATGPGPDVQPAPTAAPPSAGAFRAYDNYDMEGGDIRKVEKVEQQECVAACASDAACKGYSYDKWNRYCYLKNELSALILDPSAVTAVRPDTGEPKAADNAPRLDRRPGRKFSGDKTGERSKSTLEQCAADCREDSRCLGYTFFKAGGVCQSFGAITTFLQDKAATSAVKTQSVR